ncbi:MAG: flagellar assembly protein FliW [Zoogloeaceae bacterium]|jgi:flagellar assembly factor FliW|nr:flagellar assembly protein FliW [Zoogloeaceae bacterium]
MQFDTHLFGNVEVNPDQIIEFPHGLISFESNKRFMLIHEAITGQDPVSFTLQSLDDKTLAFQIIDPTALGFTYELELSDEEIRLIKLEKPEDAAILLVLFKQEDGAAIRLGANLRAPLVLNPKSRLGLQKLMHKTRPNITLSNLSATAA